MATGRIDTAALRAAVNLGAFIGAYIPLKKAGSDMVARCPFHTEKTPSFTVTDKGFYHCFGCGAHGDAIDFVQNYENIGFRDAAKAVARYAGVDLPDDEGLQESEILMSRHAAKLRKMESAMVQYLGVLALSTSPVKTRVTAKDATSISKAGRTMLKAIPSLFDVNGPRETPYWPKDMPIHEEIMIMWRGMLGRNVEREHGATIRSVRPEAPKFPRLPPEREIIAARRVLDWATSTYKQPARRKINATQSRSKA